jgi:FkbM family methyltransferase
MTERTSLRHLSRSDSRRQQLLGLLHRAELFLIGDRLVKLEVDELGLRYFMPTRGIMGQLVRQYGVYEEHIVNWTIDRFGDNPGGIFVDAGANVGWYTCLYGKLAGASGKVFAFEPEPTNYATLCRNITLNKLTNVKAFQAAVGSELGILNLNLGHKSNPGSHSLLSGHYTRGSIKVDIITLDDSILPKLKPEQWIDLLKIDVEGFEYDSFRGAGIVLSRTKNVVMEYSPELMKRGNRNPEALIELILASGFKMRRFRHGASPESVTKDQVLEIDDQADLLLFRD